MRRHRELAIWRQRFKNAKASRTRLALISGDLLDQVDHTAPQLQVFDIREGLGQCEPIGAGQEFGDVVGNRGLRRAVLALLRGPGDTLKKERNRNLQDLGDVLQPAGANPVGSLFVFLDLLESQPQPFAELLLTHSQHQPAHAHTGTDVLVRGIWRLFCHHHHWISRNVRLGQRCPGPKRRNKEWLRRGKVHRSLVVLSLKRSGGFIRWNLTTNICLWRSLAAVP